MTRWLASTALRTWGVQGPKLTGQTYRRTGRFTFFASNTYASLDPWPPTAGKLYIQWTEQQDAMVW